MAHLSPQWGSRPGVACIWGAAVERVIGMFSISLRIHRRRLATGLLAAALVLSGGVCARERMFPGSVRTEGQASPKKVDRSAANEQQRQNFMAAYGWQPGEEPLEVRSVLIPAEFDEEYERYNYIQKQQGCDLSRYRGRECRQYVYPVENYPGGVEDARITLLIYKDRVIGGDVRSAAADGFMHGFDAASSVWLGLPEASRSTLAPGNGG